MSAPRIRELEKMAALLSATARELPPGQDRQDAFREISNFRDKIAALKIAEQSARTPKAQDD